MQIFFLSFLLGSTEGWHKGIIAGGGGGTIKLADGNYIVAIVAATVIVVAVSTDKVLLAYILRYCSCVSLCKVCYYRSR